MRNSIRCVCMRTSLTSSSHCDSVNRLRSWPLGFKLGFYVQTSPMNLSDTHVHTQTHMRVMSKQDLPLTHSYTSQHRPGVPSPRETKWGNVSAEHCGKVQTPGKHSHLRARRKPDRGKNIKRRTFESQYNKRYSIYNR